MKKILSILAVFTLSATASHALERSVVDAAKACHDYLWEVPKFKDLPNAAISVFPDEMDGDTIIINWNVRWDEPTVRAAGNCTVIRGEIEGYEDFTE